MFWRVDRKKWLPRFTWYCLAWAALMGLQAFFISLIIDDPCRWVFYQFPAVPLIAVFPSMATHRGMAVAVVGLIWASYMAIVAILFRKIAGLNSCLARFLARVVVIFCTAILLIVHVFGAC